MVRSAKILVALLCIAAVLALCIAPYVDIPVTALRSLQIALLLMLSLVTAVLSLTDLFYRLSLCKVVVRIDQKALAHSTLLLNEATCIQRC